MVFALLLWMVSQFKLNASTQTLHLISVFIPLPLQSSLQPCRHPILPPFIYVPVSLAAGNNITMTTSTCHFDAVSFAWKQRLEMHTSTLSRLFDCDMVEVTFFFFSLLGDLYAIAATSFSLSPSLRATWTMEARSLAAFLTSRSSHIHADAPCRRDPAMKTKFRRGNITPAQPPGAHYQQANNPEWHGEAYLPWRGFSCANWLLTWSCDCRWQHLIK